MAEGRPLILRAFRLAVVVSFVATSQATPCLAQNADQELATFFAPVEVPLVSVDVYVSDRDGHPVAGLTLEDFRVTEDGRPVEISHFFAAPGVVAPPDEAAELEVEEAADEAVSQDIYFVVYVDDTNLSRGRRRAAIDHLEHFLKSDLPAGFKVMMVAYDGRIHVVQPFTDDPEVATAALGELNKRASTGRRNEEESMIRNMEATRAMAATSPDQAASILENSGSAIYQQIESYAEQLAQRTRTGFENLEKVVRSLSGLEGRKGLLLISDGVEPRPGERLFTAWGDIFGSVPIFEIQAAMSFNEARQYDLTSEFTAVTHYANSHRVTLYTLSSLGGGSLRTRSAESRFLDEGDLAIRQGMSEDVLMSSMADGTGGRPLVNSPALGDQLDEVAEELGSYYSLAYRPDHVGDGKYHRIKVEVVSRSVRVRHRDGYTDSAAADRVNDRVMAAAIHGIANNTMGIALQAFEATERDDGTYSVPIMVVIPIAELVLVPDAEEHRGKISILMVVRDEDGGLSDVHRLEYPIPIANNEMSIAIGKTAGFTVRLGVRKGRQRIAVGVLDEIGRTESVATLEVDMGSADG